MISGWRHTLERAWLRGDRWLVLLQPFAAIFRVLVGVRRACYRFGLLRVYRAPVPVIVIGNITAGGTGKTPVVIALVQALSQHGLRAGVVSRGYRARRSHSPHVVGPGSTVADCGDEALVIQRRTGCPCVTAPVRAEAARQLMAVAQVDVIISDDGLQHYALARDMEVVLFDVYRAFGNGRLLPAGPLREPLTRLAEAEYVLSRGIDDSADVILQPECLVNLKTGQQTAFTPTSMGSDVYAVVGVGSPEGFLASLRAVGFQLEPRIFPDHHHYSRADFAHLADRPIIMTEKDAVKCVGLAGGNAWYLRVSARLPQRLVDDVIHLASN